MDQLCIAIPTYNRSALVRSQIERLLPQLRHDVHIHVFDNASTDDTAQSLNPFTGEKLRVSSSVANVGMAGNICRALEDSIAEWVWVLGDDDPVTANAVDDAFQMIAEAKRGVIEFRSLGGNIETDREINSLSSLYENHDAINTLFISSHIFHKKSVSPHFGVLAPGCFTFGPHTALIIRMLETNSGSLWLFRKSLLTPTHTVKGWSSLEVALGLSLLPEFIKTRSIQRIGARRLLMDSCWMLSFGLREIVDKPSAGRWRRITGQVFGNLQAYGAGPLPLGDTFRKPTRREAKDFLIIFAARLLPRTILIRIGALFRQKHKHDRGVAIQDL
jgi:glycosyltransferase involved in cell wall biosynthesis